MNSAAFLTSHDIEVTAHMNQARHLVLHTRWCNMRCSRTSAHAEHSYSTGARGKPLRMHHSFHAHDVQVAGKESLLSKGLTASLAHDVHTQYKGRCICNQHVK
eukprot:1157362-Pelagomonas_calceolata.AAC.15